MTTGNVDRIKAELVAATERIPQRSPGYRERLAAAAMDCITTTSEHDHRKTNINQRFDSVLQELAATLGEQPQRSGQ